MRKLLFILLFLFSYEIQAQMKTVTTFNKTSDKDLEVCATSGDFLSEKQVVDLITELLSKVGEKNRYIIKNCTQVENCQATIDKKGRPYILYNPGFLGNVKKLNFSNSKLPVADKDWVTLTILAHELGHHKNNHFTNPLPDATQREMELEADETAGFIIKLMRGTLQQAQLAYTNLPEEGDYEHPDRQKRLNAVAKGWNDAPNPQPVGRDTVQSPSKEKKTFEAYLSDGELNLKLENYAESLNDYNKAIELIPSNSQAYEKRAQVKEKLKDKAGAIKDYTIAINLSPGTHLLLPRAKCKFDLKDYASAIDDLDVYIKDVRFTFSYDEKEFSRDRSESFILRGLCKINSGTHNGGCDDFLRAKSYISSSDVINLIKKYCE